MRKLSVLLLLVLITSFYTVDACPPSYVEYGIRVQFVDCENTDGYLVDILFNKNDIDSDLYSSSLNSHYFYDNESIRNIAQEDISLIPYLNYENDWISYRAYYEFSYVHDMYGDCIFVFGDDEMFSQNIPVFKVVILDSDGLVIATSPEYSSSIAPDHEEDHFGEAVLFDQLDNSFRLQDYEAEYEIHDCSSMGTVYLFMFIIYGIGAVGFVLIVFAESIIALAKRYREETMMIVRLILLGFNAITLILILFVDALLGLSILSLFLVFVVQVIKLIYVYRKERSMFVLSTIASVLIVFILYLLAGRFGIELF